MTEIAMKPQVYIETTIPSAYHEVRTDLETAVRREWTRKWWDNHRAEYDLFTSEAVIDELERGDYPHQQNSLDLISEITILAHVEAIDEITEAYIRHQLMPANPLGDALHLAMASYHRCDFLVTWNCRHLANANKFAQIRRVNTLLGLFVPTLVTPLELLGEDATP